ncbi:MAG: hypothetical protein JSV88_19965 [Candidatus Aminicenantes bacterium]|nr:MAG: hypothetical protein JSV88_19965 [Candidatus Aminicenantes bacterium]
MKYIRENIGESQQMNEPFFLFYGQKKIPGKYLEYRFSFFYNMPRQPRRPRCRLEMIVVRFFPFVADRE